MLCLGLKAKKTSTHDMNVPQYGWKVEFDHEFPDPRTPFKRPKFKQIFQLLPLIIRSNYIYFKI